MSAVEFANLTNGRACAPTTAPTMRLQSTACEQKRWAFVLLTLPTDFYLALASGPVVVHDQSERSRLTRAQWQGLSWVRYVVRREWGCEPLPEFSRNGMNVTGQWAALHRSLPAHVRSYVRWHGKSRTVSQIDLRACECDRIAWREARQSRAG